MHVSKGSGKSLLLPVIKIEDVAPFLKQNLDDMLTLCEPILYDASIIFSDFEFDFKVKVLNDFDGGIVRLFELSRYDMLNRRSGHINPFLLLSNLIHPTNQDQFVLESLSSFSPFIKDWADIVAAHASFEACTSGLQKARRLIENGEFERCISEIHERLEMVLVERLDLVEFINRFDRLYTFFFLSREASNNFISTGELVQICNDIAGKICLVYPSEGFQKEVSMVMSQCHIITAFSTVDSSSSPFAGQQFFLIKGRE